VKHQAADYITIHKIMSLQTLFCGQVSYIIHQSNCYFEYILYFSVIFQQYYYIKFSEENEVFAHLNFAQEE